MTANGQASATEPFRQALQRLKAERGWSFRRLAEATKAVDEGGQGLSGGYLAQLANGYEHPVPRSLELIARAFGQEPAFFVEYRLALWRDALDERVDFEEAVGHLAALEELPADLRERAGQGRATFRGHRRARARRASAA